MTRTEPKAIITGFDNLTVEPRRTQVQHIVTGFHADDTPIWGERTTIRARDAKSGWIEVPIDHLIAATSKPETRKAA